MTTRLPRRVAVIALLTLSALATPLAQSGERVDLAAVARIKEEGLQRSQVMDTAWYLTDVHGARLTNSPAMIEAARWAIDRLTGWGLQDVRRENWGPFGRGWENEHVVARVVGPRPFDLMAYAQAWTPGTDGPVTADAVVAVIDEEKDFETWRGKLKGKVVLARPATDVRALFTPTARRLTDSELDDIQEMPVRAPRRQGNGAPPRNIAQDRLEFFAREGVAAVLEPGSGRNDHGAVLVTGPRQNRDPKAPPAAPQLTVAAEQYNRLVRLAERGQPVRVMLDVRSRFVDDTLDTFNIVAELRGTDRADEVVMLGAHFDSWHTGTGATDNAAGVAVMMEAMRILRATGLPLRRTVRLALWTGEEQGLLGSRAYVRQQFGDPDTMRLLPGHARLSGYFNMDNGTGAIRGVYLQGNEAIRPVFDAWMQPLRDIGMEALTIRGTAATDHVPFDEVGLPGFQFVQDPIEYGSHSHHTNMDLYDRLQAEDLMKNAAIVATFVYQAANRDDLLPRKAPPTPRVTQEGQVSR
ncbi:MAG: M20/M25/M40 family metallo-hydrolase [Acidobacteria bacterium]|nr:M20/M25/M40 family metallo-hydrolase [Acidobacteriota bacterium]